MIGFLKGQVHSVGDDTALMIVQGVGYEVLCAADTLAHLQEKLDEESALWIHTHVREDALQLFGFASQQEKEIFLALLKVNGVGPKMAMGILSGARAEKVLEMIEAGDAKALSALPRVGKKTAEQIILTLQGKRVRISASPALAVSSAQKQIHTALLNLGFKSQKIDEFIQQLPKDIDVEEGVRRGLGALSSAL